MQVELSATASLPILAKETYFMVRRATPSQQWYPSPLWNGLSPLCRTAVAPMYLHEIL